MLTPVAEYDSEVSSVGSVGIRRHSACDVTSCLEHQGYSALSVGIETTSTPRLSLDHDHALNGVMRGATGQPALISPSVFIHTSAGCLHSADPQTTPSEADKAISSPPSCSSSPETIVLQGLDSLESDPDGIFIDFSHCRSDSFGTSRKTSWCVMAVEWIAVKNSSEKHSTLFCDIMWSNYVCYVFLKLESHFKFAQKPRLICAQHLVLFS